MSPYLYQEIYQQLTRILNRKIALVDSEGRVIQRLSNLPALRQVEFASIPSRDKLHVAVIDEEELIAIPLYWQDQLIALVVVQLQAEDIQTLQLITSLAELVTEQFMALHQPQPDSVDLLMTRLLYRPASLGADELDQQMNALGYKLSIQRSVLLLELEGFWDHYLHSLGQPLGEKGDLIAAKKSDIRKTLASFFSKGQDNVIGYVGNDRFVVIKDLSGSDFDQFVHLLRANLGKIMSPLKNVYIKNITVALGNASHSAAGLLISAEEALQALDFGLRLEGPNKLYRREDLGVLPLLFTSSVEQKKEHAFSILKEIYTDKDLLITLEAFLAADLNLTKTSEDLAIHRNTVIYRLDKITELLGRDPRSFTNAVELYLALQLIKTLADINTEKL